MLFAAAVALLVSTALAQVGYPVNSNVTKSIRRKDNGTYGPPVEEVHYFYDQLPIGLAVTSTGRIFTCYTRGTYSYTLGIVTNKTAEKPFPSSGSFQNLPPTALNTSWHGIDFGSDNATALISVQALYITPKTHTRPETLWVVDTGRPTIHSSAGNPSMPYAQPGGPKIVAFNISANSAGGFNDTAYASYTFPSTVHFPDSYMNDIRFDLRAAATNTTSGVAYIVDSSDEGRPGFIILDLWSGESWRRLTQDPSVLRVAYNVPTYIGHPFYYRQKGHPISTLREGLDGLQLTPDGKRLYYSPLTSTVLYSIPTLNLRARDSDPLAELAAHSNISSHGQRGAPANGFEGDSSGKIYQLMPTQNAIFYYEPNDLQTHTFIRDPRILWPDSASIAEDGFLYVTVTQLFGQPDWNYGEDERQKPGAILRARLAGGARKIDTLG